MYSLLFHYFITFVISFSVLPTIRARQSEVNATADIGSSALLACDADGFPEPTVAWAQYVIRCCHWPILMSRILNRISGRSERSQKVPGLFFLTSFSRHPRETSLSETKM